MYLVILNNITQDFFKDYKPHRLCPDILTFRHMNIFLLNGDRYEETNLRVDNIFLQTILAHLYLKALVREQNTQ